MAPHPHSPASNTSRPHSAAHHTAAQPKPRAGAVRQGAVSVTRKPFAAVAKRSGAALATIALTGGLGAGVSMLVAPSAAAQSSLGSVDSSTLPDVGSLLPSLPSLPSGNPGGGLPALNPAAQGPHLELSADKNLRSDETITVKGTGYRAGEKIYVTQTIEKPASGYPSTYADAKKVTVAEDGTFTTELKVTTSFNEVDCTTQSCYIASFTAFPKLYDRSQDSWTPISFAGGQTPRPADTSGTSGAGSPGTSQRPGQDSAGSPAPGNNAPGASNGNNTNNGAAPAPAPAPAPAVNVTSASNSSGASINLSKTTQLNPAGDTIRVTGRGFKTSGNGVYVGIAQQNQYNTTNADTFGPGTVWVSKNKGNLNADGTFSIDLPVSAKFGSADCLANQCAVYTFAAHGSSDRSQDTAVPVSFAGGVGPASAAETSASQGRGGSGSSGASGSTPQRASSTNRSSGAQGSAAAGGSGSATGGGDATGLSSTSASGASVSLSTTEISPTGTTPITITGDGFKTSGNGIYVAVAEKSKFSTTDADAFGPAAWIQASDMSASGGFTTTLDVEAVFPAGNCIENQCALFTFAAHGSTDRSQDTATDLVVTGSEAEKKKASEEAKKKQEEARKAARNAVKGSSTGSSESDVDVDNVAASTNQVSWPFGVALGVLGTLAAVFAALLFQEKRKSRMLAEELTGTSEDDPS